MDHSPRATRTAATICGTRGPALGSVLAQNLGIVPPPKRAAPWCSGRRACLGDPTWKRWERVTEVEASHYDASRSDLGTRRPE